MPEIRFDNKLELSLIPTTEQLTAYIINNWDYSSSVLHLTTTNGIDSEGFEKILDVFDETFKLLTMRSASGRPLNFRKDIKVIQHAYLY